MTNIRPQDAPQEWDQQEENQYRWDLARQIEAMWGRLRGDSRRGNGGGNGGKSGGEAAEIAVEDAHGTSIDPAESIELDPAFAVEEGDNAKEARIRYGPTVEPGDQSGSFSIDANDGPSQVVELTGNAELAGILNLTAPLQLLVITNGYVFGLSDKIRGPVRDFTGAVEVAVAFHRFGLRGVYGLGAGFDPDSVPGAGDEMFHLRDQMSVAATRVAMLDIVTTALALADAISVAATRAVALDRISDALAFADSMQAAATRAVILDAISNAFTFNDSMGAAATRQAVLDAISDAFAFADSMRTTATRAVVLDAISNAFAFTDSMGAAATRAVLLDAIEDALSFSDRMRVDATRTGILDAISNAFAFDDSMGAAATRQAVLDAISNAFAFADSMGAVATRQALLDQAPLTLRSWNTPAREELFVLALFRVNISGADLADAPGDLEGTGHDLVMAADLNIDQVERHGGGQPPLRLRKTGSADFSRYFSATLSATVYVQTAADMVIPFDHNNSGGGYSNWNYRDSSQAGKYEGLVDDDLFILAITRPEVGTGSNSFEDSMNVVAMRQSALDRISDALSFTDEMQAAGTRLATLDAISNAFAFASSMQAAATRATVLDAISDALSFADSMQAAATRLATLDAISDALSFADSMGAAATRRVLLDAISNAFADSMGAAATRAVLLDAISDAFAFDDSMQAAATRAVLLDAVSSLALSDWNTPAREKLFVLALFRVNISGADIADAPGDLEGTGHDLVMDARLSIDMVERHASTSPSPPMRLRKTGAGSFNQYFDSTLPATVYVQTSANTVIPFDHVQSGGGFSNWNYRVSTQAGKYEGLVDDDLFILAITRPIPPPASNGFEDSMRAVAMRRAVLDSVTPDPEDPPEPGPSSRQSWVIGQPNHADWTLQSDWAQWSRLSLQIDPALASTTTQSVSISNIAVLGTDFGTHNLFRTSSRRDLSSAWEVSPKAITLRIVVGGVTRDCVLHGPDHSSQVSMDDSSWYSWQPSSGDRARVTAWLAYLHDATTLEIRRIQVIISDASA